MTVKNASLGNVADEKAMLATGANHTVDNVIFHDAIYRTDGVHMECLYAIGVPGFTLRNSFFRDCAVMDVLLHLRILVDAEAAGLRQRHAREQRVRASGAREQRRLALLQPLRRPTRARTVPAAIR